MVFMFTQATTSGGGDKLLLETVNLILELELQITSYLQDDIGLVTGSGSVISSQQGPLILWDSKNNSRELVKVPNTRENVFPDKSSAKLGDDA